MEYIYWKRRNWGVFNTVAHWSMPESQFLRNLQTQGAFIAAFTRGKTMDDNKKTFILP
jgi:hypothetical protein